MLNRKLLLPLVGLLATGSIVGSGFSAWFFSGTVEDKNLDFTIDVTGDTSKLGEITAALTNSDGTTSTEGFRLKLDEGGYGKEKDNVGICFTDKDGKTATKLEVTYTIPEAAYQSLLATNKNVSYHVVANIASPLSTYVKFNTSVEEFINGHQIAMTGGSDDQLLFSGNVCGVNAMTPEAVKKDDTVEFESSFTLST